MSKENDLYRILFESFGDAITLIEGERFIECNASALTLFGCAREDLIGQSMLAFSPPTQPDGRSSAQIAEAVVRAALAGKPQQLEWQNQRLDGTPFYAFVSLHRIDVDDRTLVLVSLRDITERVRAEQALRESETLFRGLFEGSADAILILEGGRFVECNEMTVEMLRYDSKEAFLNTHPSQLSPEFQPDGRPSNEKADEMIAMALERGSNRFEWVHRRADGEDFDVEVLLTAIAVGERQFVHSVWRDITDRKQAEAARVQLFERRAQQAQVSAQVSQELAGVPRLDELFQRVAGLVKERLGYYHAQVFRYDAAQDRMVVVAGYGQAGQKMVAAGHSLPMGAGVVGTAAATGESVLAPDVRQNPDWQPNPNLPETRGELAVPIKLRDEVLGVLDVQSDRANALTDDDRILLESISGPIAMAVEAARLLEESTMFSQFAQASSQGLGIGDMDGRVVYANPALCRMLGEKTSDDVVGNSMMTYYPADMQQRLQREVLPALVRGERWTGELAILSRSGQVTPTLENYFVIHDQDGRPRNIAAVITNITDRRRADAELNERLRELNALYRTVSREGWQSFREQTDLPGGYVFDPTSFTIDGVDDHDPRRVLGGESEADTVLTLPLQLRGEQVGAVGINVDPQSPLSVEDQALVQSILDQAVEALESARLAEMTQRALAEAEETHRRYLRETWSEFLSGRGESVEGYLATPSEVLPAQDFWTPEMEQALVRQRLVAQMRAQPTAPASDDSAELVKTVALPIRHRGQTIGVIDIARESEDVDWSEDELAFIQSLVDEVGDLIESERLFEESEFTRAQTELLYRASQRISAAESPEQVYPVLFDTIGSTAIDQVAIVLWEQPVVGIERPSGQEVFAAFWDRSGDEPPFPLGEERPVEQDPFLTLLSAQQVIVIADADRNISQIIKETMAQMGVRTMALVPLVVAEEWQGYVSIVVKTAHAFSEDDMRIYRSVCDQAAIVLRSLRLYQEAESRARREQLIRQITNRMRVHADVDSILSTAVRELGQALGVSRAFIRLISEVPEAEGSPAVEE